MVRKTDGPETVYRKILAIEPQRGGETGTADVLRWLGNWMNLKLSAEVVAAAADDEAIAANRKLLGQMGERGCHTISEIIPRPPPDAAQARARWRMNIPQQTLTDAVNNSEKISARREQQEQHLALGKLYSWQDQTARLCRSTRPCWTGTRERRRWWDLEIPTAMPA